MTIKLLIPLSIFLLLSCIESTKNKNEVNNPIHVADTTTKDYATLLNEKEKDFLDKQIADPINLIATISFNVKTTDKEFENGLISWVSLEKPKDDIKNLVDGNKIVIPENKIVIVIDYPLKNECRFELESKNGFTREMLLTEISRKYYEIYEEEEKSATIKTIPIDKRTTMYNRNETNGKYGIWGHDIADLVLSEISVFKIANGQIILSLTIES